MDTAELTGKDASGAAASGVSWRRGKIGFSYSKAFAAIFLYVLYNSNMIREQY